MPDYFLPIRELINRAFIVGFAASTLCAAAAAIPTKAIAQNANEDPWTLTCAADNKNFCLMRSNITNADNQTIARVVIGETAVEGKNIPYINAFLPLKLLIPAGVGFRVDEGEATKLNLQYCDQQFCRAHVTLNETNINSMKRGNNLQLILTDSNSKKTLGLNFSLAGFTATFNDFKSAASN